jgi:hypothetical protein
MGQATCWEEGRRLLLLLLAPLPLLLARCSWTCLREKLTRCRRSRPRFYRCVCGWRLKDVCVRLQRKQARLGGSDGRSSIKTITRSVRGCALHVVCAFVRVCVWTGAQAARGEMTVAFRLTAQLSKMDERRESNGCI